ncbi:UNVERIFIED_CONTAM: hypothetical protein K2H54_043313 [Gekko kuhli]
MLRLDRLIELEHSSDSEVQNGSHSAELRPSTVASPLQDGSRAVPTTAVAGRLGVALGGTVSPLLSVCWAELQPVPCHSAAPHSVYHCMRGPEPPWSYPGQVDSDTRATKSSTWRPSRQLPRIRSSKLSQEESRIKVVNALREVLQKRLDDSPDLSVQKDTIPRTAKKVEKALFNLSCCVDQHYKNKYRSLLFNLKSAKNQCSLDYMVANTCADGFSLEEETACGAAAVLSEGGAGGLLVPLQCSEVAAAQQAQKHCWQQKDMEPVHPGWEKTGSGHFGDVEPSSCIFTRPLQAILGMEGADSDSHPAHPGPM